MGQRKTKPVKEFSADLAKRRADLGWTRTAMANYLGLSVGGYKKYEDGKSAPIEVFREGILARLDRLKHAGSSARMKKVEPGIAQKKK